MDKESYKEHLFHARINSVNAVIAAGVAIERLALGQGLTPLEASRFRFTVEELGTQRLDYAFGPDEPAQAHIVVELRPGEFAVIFEDTGMPLDAVHVAAGVKGWLAQLLGRGFADGLHASFEGREGNRCEITKLLGKSIKSELRGSAVAGATTKSEVEADAGAAAPHNSAAAAAIQYRDMTPADALGVATCFYRTYGFTAPVADEVIYHPDKCAARVQSGLHLGTVATVGDGRIVGHIAIERDHPDDAVGISGYLVVDPEFRGHGIGDVLSDRKLERANRAAMRGMLGMAVTVHTASQKTSLREGGHEVGVLLAAQEDRIVMRGIAADAPHERHTALPFFTKLAPDPGQPSFPPMVYREIVEQIYAACGLEREIGAPQPLNLDQLPEHTSLDVSVLQGSRFAKLRIAAYGRNFLREIFHLVGDLHQHHVNVIRLEMPLADPLTAHFARATEELGFSFAAVFPILGPGDLLCVQSLDRIEVDRDGIHIASDHGARVLAAVLASYDRVLSSNTARTLDGALGALDGA
jgi:GNAT superfamily N-acetyltransferase